MKRKTQKMQVVYGDVLFFINFCMDLISLYISGRVTSVKTTALGLVAASSIGGVYGVVSVFFPGNAALSAIIGFGVSVLMCFICFGGRCGRKNFGRAVVTMYIVSLLLGGAVTFMYSFLQRLLPRLIIAIGKDSSGEKKTLLFLGVAAVCSVITLLVRRVFAFRSQITGIKVTVTSDGRRGSFNALVDSGNLLSDPISGRKVIIASVDRLSGVLPIEILEAVKTGDVAALGTLSYRNMKRVRIIPSRSVGSGRLLIGYLPDRIEIEPLDGGSVYTVDAILAFDGDSTADFGGYEAIVPSSLVA